MKSLQLDLAVPELQQANRFRTLCIIDTETTGLDPADSQVLEVAACLFSVDHRTIFQTVSFLIPCEGKNPVEHINHIPADLTRISAPWRTGLAMLNEMLAVSDAIVAHNASFDRQWFGVGPLPAVWLPWLCTMTDFEWGCRGAGGLRDLAANHGVTIAKAHRALADVELVAGVLASREDLEDLLEQATAPKIRIAARVTYERKDEAKSRGFRWNQLKRRWEKTLTAEAYAAADFPFATYQVD